MSLGLGSLRGSTPPILDDGEYFAFFHSSIVTSSASSFGYEMYFYFMGAYTFSATPPFPNHKNQCSAHQRMTPFIPIPLFTNVSFFPGGCVIADDFVYVAYGKDDCEIWIATLDKAALKRSLIPVTPKTP